jgi:hypothetical protein
MENLGIYLKWSFNLVQFQNSNSEICMEKALLTKIIMKL